jgi:hypothetical protein
VQRGEAQPGGDHQHTRQEGPSHAGGHPSRSPAAAITATPSRRFCRRRARC